MLLDSTVIIDLLRGDAAARDWFATISSMPAASETTRAEVLRGTRSPERSLTLRTLAGYRWFPVDDEVSARAGELGRRYRASHHLGLPDLLIAATAMVHGAELVTSDVKHFPMFPGLTAPY